MEKLIIMLLMLLAGCATAPQIEYRVADYPQPPVIERPALPVETITKEMTPGEVIQKHRETIIVLEGYAQKLEAALNAYRK